MEKALEILNQQLRDETLWLDSHDEAIAELKEAQLTRREWYQKGYAEAMKTKTCKGCVHEVGDMQDLHCAFCSRSCDDNFEPKDT